MLGKLRDYPQEFQLMDMLQELDDSYGSQWYFPNVYDNGMCAELGQT
jgi:hypothetical protein